MEMCYLEGGLAAELVSGWMEVHLYDPWPSDLHEEHACLNLQSSFQSHLPDFWKA